MDRGLQLTFNLLLTLAIKLPVIAFFFKKRKRQSAVGIGSIINLVTWILGTIIWLKNPDVNQLYVRAGILVAESVAYWFFLGRNWKRAVLISVISNVIVYFATTYITLPDGFFQKKDNMIR